jgi:hypothetical protein
VPGFQGLLGILSALFGPMFPQRPFCNNSHATSFPVWEHTITLFPYREQAKNRATLDGQTQVTLIYRFCRELQSTSTKGNPQAQLSCQGQCVKLLPRW